MVAYLHGSKAKGWTLTICKQPCAGPEFSNSEKITVSGKREANKICKERGIKPWNW
ncbi:hypothetical protein [Roseibium sp.]|uniref:hypothetical protein n=1 Tax=Roseibium sp. TaxID=1936156 RepID=UPI003BA9D5CA